MNRIKKYRFDNNLSLREMGQLLGLSYTTIHNFENGRVVGERTIYYINKKFDDLIAKQEGEK